MYSFEHYVRVIQGEIVKCWQSPKYGDPGEAHSTRSFKSLILLDLHRLLQ